MPFDIDPIIAGIIKRLPKTDAAWPDAERKLWLSVLEMARIELQVGRDLQYIRINGTLIGGLVGLVIFAIAQQFR